MKTKSIFAAVLVIILTCGIFNIAVFAVSKKIDGVIHNSEWADASDFILFDKKDSSNNDIISADYRYLIDYDDCAIYFAVKFITDSPVDGSLLFGAEIIINGADKIDATADGAYSFDDYKYSCDAAFNGVDTAALIEMRIGIKYDMADKYNVTLRLIDESGSYSNKFEIILIGREPAENTETVTRETETKKTETKESEPAKMNTETHTTRNTNRASTKNGSAAVTKSSSNVTAAKNEAETVEEVTEGIAERNNEARKEYDNNETEINFEYQNVEAPGTVYKSGIKKNQIICAAAALLIIGAAIWLIAFNYRSEIKNKPKQNHNN